MSRLVLFMSTLQRTGFAVPTILDRGFAFAYAEQQMDRLDPTQTQFPDRELMERAAAQVEVAARELGIHAAQIPLTVHYSQRWY